LLILPLHRPFSRANFPFATIALVIVNVLVFAFLQSGDGRTMRQALAYYHEAQLLSVELPLYRQWLDTHAKPDAQRRAMLDAVVEHAPEMTARVLQADVPFLAALQADQLVTPDHPQHAEWKAKRQEFDRLWGRIFTERHQQRNSELDLGRAFSAMFLHGSFGHLFGNMVFLVLLGLLVEGALGSGLFVALYLLAGLGGGLFSVWYRWGEAGAGLGASGAIAGLMGAYCVLWGLRKVRVFWWAFVVFGYSRIAALWLLPFWLGWEFVNLVFNEGAGVGFDAHAGGIMSGALLAYVVRSLGWERRDFLDEDEKVDRANAQQQLLQQGMQHLGRLELAPARKLLEQADAAGPPSLDVRLALYRCARYANQPAAAALQRVLELPLVDAAAARKVKAAMDDYRKVDAAGLPLQPAQQLQLARAWMRIGADADAEQLLRELAAARPDQPGLDELCWQLAQRAREGTPQWRARLELLAQHCPRSELAPKARFLLAQA
jgi:membrane associated rhomboid family serine protease